MPDLTDPTCVIAAVESAADEAADLAERMRSIGAWGAYEAMVRLTREREALADRMHARWCQAVAARAHVAQLTG